MFVDPRIVRTVAARLDRAEASVAAASDMFQSGGAVSDICERVSNALLDVHKANLLLERAGIATPVVRSRGGTHALTDTLALWGEVRYGTATTESFERPLAEIFRTRATALRKLEDRDAAALLQSLRS
jgi:hypothetical protein